MLYLANFLAFAVASAAILESEHPYGCSIPVGKNNQEDERRGWCPTPEMKDPWWVKGSMNFQYSLDRKYGKIETPMTVHQSLEGSKCGYNCLAYSDDTAFNILTGARPAFTLGRRHRSAWASSACFATCWSLVDSSLLMGSRMPWMATLEGFGFVEDPDFPLNVEPRLSECGGMRDLCCIERVIAESGKAKDPVLLGYYIAAEIMHHTENDGWNAFGTVKWDPVQREAKPCNANCQPYGDTTGYLPRNTPNKLPKCVNGNGKCKKLNGKFRHWQPLLEHENGSFWRQEHVTPHIGYTVTPVTAARRPFKEVEDPAYKLLEQSASVLRNMQESKDDADRKNLIRFFDDKLMVRGAIESWLGFSLEWKYEDYMFFVAGISIAEHDATVQVWREKVRHDAIRPTTAARYFQDSLESKYDLQAKDWETLIRVMPHSEFPSGSACLCSAYAEFVDAFLEEMYGITSGDLPPLVVGEGGFTSGCSGNDDPMFGELPWNIGCDVDPVEMTMPRMVELCGQTRLWAGLHFEDSMSAGEELCEGIGLAAMDHVKEMRLGSKPNAKLGPWENGYGVDDPRPEGCPPAAEPVEQPNEEAGEQPNGESGEQQ